MDKAVAKPHDKPLGAALAWLRRDLRASDNAALYHALRSADRVWCVFVFDSAILEPLPRADRRVEFIHESVKELDAELRRLGRAHDREGVRLVVRHGHAVEEIVQLARTLAVQAVYASHDDDPYALGRDAKARGALADAGVALHTCKDHVVFERDEVLTASGSPYSVYTPYRNCWLKKLEPFFLEAYPVERHAAALAPLPDGVAHGLPATLGDIGFVPTNLSELQIPTGASGGARLVADFTERIGRYDTAREFPGVKGQSYLGVHLRFGTVSVRGLARMAEEHAEAGGAGARGAQVFLSELIWRDFYQQLLHHHPHVVEGSFRPEYDRVRFERGKHAEALFAAWCEGRTGYPLVDAAMAQINRTGWMHNRLRMVTASFLCKDLGLDWRWGERYFARHLNDYELASNNGGWQWAASTGSDPQPWFRIFHPVLQSRKFDAEGRFIRRYLPQLAGLSDDLIHAPWEARPVDLEAAGIVLGRDYPEPIVQHEEARQRTLARYAVVKEARAERR